MSPQARNNWIGLVGMIVSLISVILIAGRGLQRAEYACEVSAENRLGRIENTKIIAAHISANAVSDMATMRELNDIKDMLRELRSDIKGMHKP